jgi:hypothetical protein
MGSRAEHSSTLPPLDKEEEHKEGSMEKRKSIIRSTSTDGSFMCEICYETVRGPSYVKLETGKPESFRLTGCGHQFCTQCIKDSMDFHI